MRCYLVAFIVFDVELMEGTSSVLLLAQQLASPSSLRCYMREERKRPGGENPKMLSHSVLMLQRWTDARGQRVGLERKIPAERLEDWTLNSLLVVFFFSSDLSLFRLLRHVGLPALRFYPCLPPGPALCL